MQQYHLPFNFKEDILFDRVNVCKRNNVFARCYPRMKITVFRVIIFAFFVLKEIKDFAAGLKVLVQWNFFRKITTTSVFPAYTISGDKELEGEKEMHKATRFSFRIIQWIHQWTVSNVVELIISSNLDILL